MKNKKIPVFDFELSDKEKEFVNNCLDTSIIGQGSYVKDFEREFSKFVNCKFGVTTTSGTTALHLAAQAGVRYSIENPYAYMDSNLVGYLNIIELNWSNHQYLNEYFR